MGGQWLAATGTAGVSRYVEVALPIGERDCRAARGDATGVDDAIGPCGQAAADGDQRIASIRRSSVDCALRCEVVYRCGHKDVVARKCDRGAIRGMQALLFDVPCQPTVSAGTEPDRGGGHHDTGTVRVRANAVDVAIDVDGGLPRDAAVGRARDTADVDVGEEDRAVRRCGDRADPERRSHALTVDDGRARIPCLTPCDRVEAAERLECSVRADAQNAGIVGSDVDHVADHHATREIHLRGREGAPYASRRTPAKGAAVDNRESAARPVRRERSDRLSAQLLVAVLARDDEQAVAPCGHKHHSRRHDGFVHHASTLFSNL